MRSHIQMVGKTQRKEQSAPKKPHFCVGSWISPVSCGNWVGVVLHLIALCLKQSYLTQNRSLCIHRSRYRVPRGWSVAIVGFYTQKARVIDGRNVAYCAHSLLAVPLFHLCVCILSLFGPLWSLNRARFRALPSVISALTSSPQKSRRPRPKHTTNDGFLSYLAVCFKPWCSADKPSLSLGSSLYVCRCALSFDEE
ncbi:hypothetical protein L7F22_050394 [Adiantum nelumboides]|nr:hypothetical protein [Adiantum nelumboides]